MFISPTDVNFARYNAVIAGSGPAGAVLAKHLSRQGQTILVIESGGRDFDLTIQDAYAVINGIGHFGSDYWPSHWVRALGGTSAVWGGWVGALAGRNMASWPISRIELDPWYDVAAAELDRDPSVNRWSAPALPGFLSRPFSVNGVKRYGAAGGVGIWDDEHVHVLLNTTVSKLHPRADRRGIAQMTLSSGPQDRVTFDLATSQNVILAAGGMGNAQILLASDDGTGAAVGNEADQVGRYLMEHPHMYNCATLVTRRDFALPTPPDAFGKSLPALVPDDVAHRDHGGLDVSFELFEIDADEDNAMHRFIADRLGGSIRAHGIHARSEMVADPNNRVQRMLGEDPAGLPRLRATCIFNAGDYRSVAEYLTTLGQTVADNDIGRLRIQNDMIFANVTGGGHIMGTTRMGNMVSNSVADANCRVHGYENLFLAGSSLFPTGGYINPTMTIVALAARLADYLGNATA